MRDALKVTLGSPDQIGNCNVDVKYGGQFHLGHFNPADDRRRRQFAEYALGLFGWEKTPEQFAAFDAAILEELVRVGRALRPPEERLNLQGLQNMRQEGLSWLWPHRIAIGKLCVI